MSTTKDRLLLEAAKLFAQRGFDGVSVREITQAARANIAAVTYHFGSKEGLFAAVMAREMTQFREAGEQIVRADMPPEEKLYRMLEEYALIVLCRQPSLKMLFIETLSGAERLPPEVIETVNWRNRLFCDAMDEGIRMGRFRLCDVETLAWFFFGLLSSYVLYEPLMPQGRLHAYPESQVRDIVAKAMDLFLNGVCVHPRKESGTC